MSPYLTDAEIEQITHPLTQGAARIRFLRRLGYKVERRPDGQPLVLRADTEAIRGAGGRAANDPPARERNWTEFDNRVRYGSGKKA